MLVSRLAEYSRSFEIVLGFSTQIDQLRHDQKLTEADEDKLDELEQQHAASQEVQRSKESLRPTGLLLQTEIQRLHSNYMASVEFLAATLSKTQDGYAEAMVAATEMAIAQKETKEVMMILILILKLTAT